MNNKKNILTVILLILLAFSLMAYIYLYQKKDLFEKKSIDSMEQVFFEKWCNNFAEENQPVNCLFALQKTT